MTEFIVEVEKLCILLRIQRSPFYFLWKMELLFSHYLIMHRAETVGSQYGVIELLAVSAAAIAAIILSNFCIVNLGGRNHLKVLVSQKVFSLLFGGKFLNLVLLVNIVQFLLYALGKLSLGYQVNLLSLKSSFVFLVIFT